MEVRTVTVPDMGSVHVDYIYVVSGQFFPVVFLFIDRKDRRYVLLDYDGEIIDMHPSDFESEYIPAHDVP